MSRHLRSFAQQVVSLAPHSQAYKPDDRPLLAIDESANSRKVSLFVRAVVGASIVSGGITLATEVYRRADGSIAPYDFEGKTFKDAMRTLRNDSSLTRRPFPDRKVVSLIIALLHSHRHIVILSADLGTQPDGLRELLRTCLAPELTTLPQLLGVTLLLKGQDTKEFVFISNAFAQLLKPEFAPGFREIMI